MREACTARSTGSKPVSKTRGHQSSKNLSRATTRITPRVATRWWYPRARAMVLRPFLGVTEPAGRSEHALGGRAGAHGPPTIPRRQRSEHPRPHTRRNPRGQHRSTRRLTIETTHGGSKRARAASHSTKLMGATLSRLSYGIRQFSITKSYPAARVCSKCA